MNDKEFFRRAGISNPNKLEKMLYSRVFNEDKGRLDKANEIHQEILKYLETDEGQKDLVKFSKVFKLAKANGTEVIIADDLEMDD